MLYRSFFSIILSLILTSKSLSSSEIFEPHPINQTEGRKCEVALCCVFQNEADWLREWVEYHKLIGIGHFYLYNNVSTDHYLKVLTPYLESGEVELFEFSKTPLQVSDQQMIYDHALGLAKGSSTWLAAIDTDEFIVPWETKNLTSYLETLPADCGSIEINWLTFGTSYVKKLLPGELLIEKLILRAPINAAVNVWYKSIIKTNAATSWSNPHRCNLQPGYCITRANTPDPGNSPVSEEAVSRIRIHHYIWRTEDFFYQVKLPRIAKWDQNLFHCTSPLDYLPITNSVLDVSMLWFVPALKGAMNGKLNVNASESKRN